MFGANIKKVSARLGLTFASTVIFVAAIMSVNPAHSVPLSKSICQSYQNEHDAMLLAGIGEILKKGPNWAKSNLGSTKLTVLERYFTLSDWLELRCPVEFTKSYKLAQQKKRQAAINAKHIEQMKLKQEQVAKANTKPKSGASVKPVDDPSLNGAILNETSIQPSHTAKPMTVGARKKILTNKSKIQLPPKPNRKK